MQQEDQLIWLIQTLQPYSTIFQTMYGITFKITDTIICKSAEPKQWYYMDDKFNIKQRDEEWLKWKVISIYFRQQNLTADKMAEIMQMDNIENYEGPSVTGTAFYFEQKISKGKIYRTVSQDVAAELFRNPAEKVDVLSNWSKIIGCDGLERPKHLFLIQYCKATPNSQSKMIFLRRRMCRTPLLMEEIVKADNVGKKVVQMKEECDRSMATQLNDKCEHFMRSLCRFIEGKSKKQLGKLEVEIFLTDGDFSIYLIGLETILFFNDENKPEQCDLLQLELQQTPISNFVKCSGVYCKHAHNNIFYDENDEQFSLFIMANDVDKQHLIPYKSIFLDLVERYKTIESIKQASPGMLVPEQLIFKLRKYYSISQLMASPHFKHFKTSNFYKNRSVCNFCFNVYNKLDCLRNRALEGSKSRKSLKITEIAQEVDKYFATSNANKAQLMASRTLMKEKSEFDVKMAEFDTDQLKFFNEFQITVTTDDKYFSRRKGRQQIQQSTSQQIRGFQLPKVTRMTMNDKDNMIKKQRLFIPRDQAEALGLKHYLGHVRNLPYADQGLAISKSSLELNKLQDKIREIQMIKERMEQEKVRQVREDIEMIMCTYYGKGQQEKDRLIDYVESLKQRDYLLDDDAVEESQQNQYRIQIATDKNEFLTENQRRQKQDKEKQEQEILQTKKDFMELHGDLASSVYQQRLSMSPGHNSDIYSEL